MRRSVKSTLPKERLATKPILATIDQHKRFWDLAESNKKRMTDLLDEALLHLEGIYELENELKVEG